MRPSRSHPSDALLGLQHLLRYALISPLLIFYFYLLFLPFSPSRDGTKDVTVGCNLSPSVGHGRVFLFGVALLFFCHCYLHHFLFDSPH